MVDALTVKQFLRLDTDEDISLYLGAAEEYFRDAVGKDPDPNRYRDVYAVCAIVQELYDSRTYIGPEKGERIRHVVRSILDHIRLDLEGGDSDDS